MFVKLHTLRIGDKFLFPATHQGNVVSPESVHGEPCILINDGFDGCDFVVIRNGMRGQLPCTSMVQKVEGFRYFYDKRLT